MSGLERQVFQFVGFGKGSRFFPALQRYDLPGGIEAIEEGGGEQSEEGGNAKQEDAAENDGGGPFHTVPHEGFVAAMRGADVKAGSSFVLGIELMKLGLH